MILQNLITQVKHGVLQNYGTLMVDDNDAIFQISNMLGYIYSYRVRKWALVREQITSTTNVLTLATKAITVFKITDSNDIEYKPSPVPFDTTDPNVSGGKYYFHTGNTITISDTERTFKVWYLKIPDRMSLSTVDDEIDLPDEYINILYLLVMWMLYPYNLENGASLANNFKSMADDVLKTYEKTHSLGIAPTSVQFSDLFKGK